MCSKCKVCNYYSKDFQQNAWKTLKGSCNAINLLSQWASCKAEVSNVLMLPKDNSKMSRLVLKKNITIFFANKVLNSILLDTVAQASLVSKHWLN